MSYVLVAANWLLPLLYLALLVDYGATFFLRIRTASRGRSVAAVVVVHAAFLALRAIHLHRLPLMSSFEILSAVALASAAVYWVIERAGRDRRAGAFVFLLLFVFQYTSTVYLAHGMAGPEASPPGEYRWEQVHIIPSVLAYTAITLAGVYGGLELVALRNLKHRRFGLLFDRLPPVELLGRMIGAALLVGLGFLTVSMMTGFLYAWGEPHAGLPLWKAKIVVKVVLGSIAWGLCLAGLAGRWLGRWPLRRVSAIAVADFIVVLALLIGSAALS